MASLDTDVKVSGGKSGRGPNPIHVSLGMPRCC